MHPPLAPLASLLAAALLAATSAQAQTQPLNDTGITWSGHATNGNATICDPSHPAGQDCHHGRDKATADNALTKMGSGSAGFDFTKIANNGTALPDSAVLGSAPTAWACTRDNVTGLVWEVKVNDANHLRHMNHTYTWYSTNTATNGGANGTANGGTCQPSGACDTEKYVANVNAGAGLCGETNWRMPTVKELEGIADLGRSNPAIDPDFFPNTSTVWPSSVVWSGSPLAGLPNLAWGVYFNDGGADGSLRSNGFSVRLVRGGQ